MSAFKGIKKFFTPHTPPATERDQVVAELQNGLKVQTEILEKVSENLTQSADALDSLVRSMRGTHGTRSAR